MSRRLETMYNTNFSAPHPFLQIPPNFYQFYRSAENVFRLDHQNRTSAFNIIWKKTETEHFEITKIPNVGAVYISKTKLKIFLKFYREL